MLTKLTDQGRKTIKEKPKRTQEVNKEVVAMGGKVVAQYAVLGPYDFVNVVQALNNKTRAGDLVFARPSSPWIRSQFRSSPALLLLKHARS